MADRSPVYAELRNLIDLSVLAAYIQQQNYYGKAGWKMPFFGDEKSMPVETLRGPQAGLAHDQCLDEGGPADDSDCRRRSH